MVFCFSQLLPVLGSLCRPSVMPLRIMENSGCYLHGASGNTKEENLIQSEDVQLSNYEDSQASLYLKKDGSDKGVLSPNASSYAPSSHILAKSHEKIGTPRDSAEGLAYGKANGETKHLNSRGASYGSDSMRGVAASRGSGLSPSSSVGSLSSEKSSLNPNAKEFKLNPNAKSFIPSPARPPTPVSDSSFYFPTTVNTVPNMLGVPMTIEVGPNFAGTQPIIYNPQVSQMPTQAYFHPNAPQYGQLLGHPRQALYMPTYLPGAALFNVLRNQSSHMAILQEMPYKGRDY
ncbi:uncharacterized protein [Cicer arietinum]|uniref:uncharacterized protein isoform X4 n=2 Tax=Cicer arietinum TaxID=3827 RepID=UPI003CC5C6A0